MHDDGIILASALADILHVSPGDTLTVEVREGRQPVLQVPVAGIAETLLGSPAYMDLDALNHSLREPNRVSGAYLSIDGNKADAIYARCRTCRPSQGSASSLTPAWQCRS